MSTLRIRTEDNLRVDPSTILMIEGGGFYD